MLNIRLLAAVFFLLFFCQAHAQKKSLNAIFTENSITIDGNIDESKWNSAPIATDFIMFEPDNGKPISPDKKTEVRILYDNNAIYVSALLFDNEPSTILKEITDRDNFGTSEHFGVYINGYNDGQQDFRFYVSAAGVQMDALATEDNEDFSWNAIWDSEVTLTDFGWSVEMRIPYAALRFSNESIQTWGVNFYREIRRDRQKYTWNHVDANIATKLIQTGELNGIENIKTPTRLFFIPYSSYYYNHVDSGQSDHTFKAGMDIKYGINDSFTLDAILVPDFGQTRFDNLILNLSPFEQEFNENRPFFTEGTDIFDKGSLLYSRRIGAEPSTYPITSENEQVIDYPSTVELINAVKVSGRTNKGLGIGVLNALTKKTYATVKNDLDEIRKVVVEPLVNYNLVVLDQRFNQNSSVSFANSNVTRDGGFRDANVTALAWDIKTKANTYKLAGDFKYSYINTDQDYSGFKTYLNFLKISGKHRFDILGKYISADYDINDMGIIFQTNYHNAYAAYSYRILNPIKYFNALNVNLASSAEIQNTTGKLQDYTNSVDITANTTSNDYLRLNLVFRPLETFDFYEARVPGRFSEDPKSFSSYALISSNYNRKLAIDLSGSTYITDQEGRYEYGISVSPRYRISDKILLIYANEYYKEIKTQGFVDLIGSDIRYSERDRETITSELSGRYSINNKMTINLTARYYWSYSENQRLYTLKNDGKLDFFTNDDAQTSAYDQNLNLWNFDLSYSWWFAPASQISVMYRNSALDYRDVVNKGVKSNLDDLFSNNLNTVFSVSIRYFVDYNSLKKKS